MKAEQQVGKPSQEDVKPVDETKVDATMDNVFTIPTDPSVTSVTEKEPEENILVKAARIQQEMMDLIDKKAKYDKYAQHLDSDATMRICEALRSEQILCFISSRAADDQIAQLSRRGIVKYVISDDGDCIAQGVKKTLRGVSEHFYYRYRLEKEMKSASAEYGLTAVPLAELDEGQVAEDGNTNNDAPTLGKFIQCYDYEKILEALKLTKEEFVDLCILLGHDNDPKVDGIGPVNALKFIRQYKSIEKIIEAINKNEIGAYPVKKEPKNPRKRSVQVVAATSVSSSSQDHKRVADASPMVIENVVNATPPPGVNATSSTPILAVPAAPIKTNKFNCSQKFLERFTTLRRIITDAPCDNDFEEIQESINLEYDRLLQELE